MQQLTIYGWALIFVCLFLSSNSYGEQPLHQSVKIAVISDLNGSYGSTKYNKEIPKVISHLVDIKPDLVISTGDMIAGQRVTPLFKRSELEAMWQSFHKNISDVLAEAELPFAITAGNHDGSLAKKFHLERKIYQEQWLNRVPDVNFVDRSHYPFYYAFEIKNIFFISLDASIVGHLSAKQFSWLKELLKQTKDKYRHQIAFSHLPLWPFTESRENEIIGDPALETLLQQHNVTLYLNGHHHAFYPGYKDGITYVSQACMGSGLRKYLGSSQLSRHGFTLIDIDDNDKINITGYETSDLKNPVDVRQLPKEIKSRYATLIREDRVNK